MRGVQIKLPEIEIKLIFYTNETQFADLVHQTLCKSNIPLSGGNNEYI